MRFHRYLSAVPLLCGCHEVILVFIEVDINMIQGKNLENNAYISVPSLAFVCLLEWQTNMCLQVPSKHKYTIAS